MKNILLYLVLFLGSTTSFAQQLNKVKLDSLFSIIKANDKGMGSLSIFKEGEQVYTKTIGYASAEQNLRATSKTKYRIGSITKTFTAVLLMKLVEEQKLSLDTKLNAFFPKIEGAENITIEHMLRHRSGIFNFTSSKDFGEWSKKQISKEDLISKIIEGGVIFTPDAKMSYSNSNYVLLTFIIEEIEGKKYSEILKEFITSKIDLKDTYYGGKINIDNKEAFSYLKSTDTWIKSSESNMTIPQGAGGIVSTPKDLCLFYDALFNGKIISEASVLKMTKLQDGFGLGLFRIPFYNKSALGHNGRIDNFQSSTAYFLKEKMGIAYISNGTDMSVNEIMKAVLSIYYNKEYELPTFNPVLEVPEESLKQYLGVYSAPNFPFKIFISKQGSVLFARATGQSAFVISPYEEHKFKFDGAGIKIEFLPQDNSLIFKQGQAEFKLVRE